MVYYTSYANEKFSLLERHGLLVHRNRVEAAIAEAEESIIRSEKKFLSADGAYDETRNLRVWVRKEDLMLMVITFYPVKKPKAKKKT